MQNTFLGFDLSTQKLKAVLINDKLQTLNAVELKFDIDLPEFNTHGGVQAGEAENEFFCDPVMWIKALGMVLDRLVRQGADLSTVAAIGGSAQQHGSVFWSNTGLSVLRNLDVDKFMHTQLTSDCFTTLSPIWMNHSTTTQCNDMEESVGGRDQMVYISGSKCYERFTGPQIRKVYQTQPAAYENCERISLVSSFLASLLLNKVASIDFSDGSGMNLLDINHKSWSPYCLSACAPNLADKLGNPVPSNSILGVIGQYFVQRYKFNPNCKVVASTGDNPSALAGLNIGTDWLAFSLGTSDTIMMSLDEHPKLQEGHVLLHPTQENFMGLLCFKNGALVRDTFKKCEANNNWELFNEILDSTPRGNSGNMALHFIEQEIIPNVKGTLRWSAEDSLEHSKSKIGLTKFSSHQTEIRALIEGQMLNRKAFALDMGFSFGENTKILATGGSSSSRSILQVMSDVFNAPVYIQKTPEAACLGACYRAFYITYLTDAKSNGKEILSYHDFITQFNSTNQRVCDPSPDSDEIYKPMLKRYREMVEVMKQTQLLQSQAV